MQERLQRGIGWSGDVDAADVERVEADVEVVEQRRGDAAPAAVPIPYPTETQPTQVLPAYASQTKP